MGLNRNEEFPLSTEYRMKTMAYLIACEQLSSGNLYNDSGRERNLFCVNHYSCYCYDVANRDDLNSAVKQFN